MSTLASFKFFKNLAKTILKYLNIAFYHIQISTLSQPQIAVHIWGVGLNFIHFLIGEKLLYYFVLVSLCSWVEILPPVPFVCIITEHQAWLPVFYSSFPRFYTCLCARSLQLCPALCDPVDHSLPGSSVHGILQARILEWVAMPSSRGSSPLRDGTCVSYIFCIGRRFLYHYTTWEVHTWSCISVNATFSILPTLTVPHCVSKFPTRFTGTIFIDSIYMH